MLVLYKKKKRQKKEDLCSVECYCDKIYGEVIHASSFMLLSG